MVKNLPECERPGFNPWVMKIPWRREWQATPVFLPGKSHGQRSLGWGRGGEGGYSPWGHKELDMTEQLTLSLFTFPGDTVDKNPSASAGDMGLIPGWERSPGVGNSKPLQYSCLENPMDRGALRATVHNVSKSRT